MKFIIKSGKVRHNESFNQFLSRKGIHSIDVKSFNKKTRWVRYIDIKD